MAKRRTSAEGKQRRCSRCKKYKPTAQFPRNAATADGLAVYCRECKRLADRERARPKSEAAPQHPPTPPLGEDQNSETPRVRAPALAISDDLIERAAEVVRTTGATRRAAARAVGVSENTFKSWLKEAADLKDDEDPRRRLLFAIESAEGAAELELTRAYFAGARLDPQVAQRFLERRFSKGDEKWARTEHLSVTDGDAAPMEMTDARKLLAEKLEKLLGNRGAAGSDPGRAADGGPPSVGNAGAAAVAEP